MKKNHRKSSLFIACLFTITIFTISCGGGGGGGGGTNPPPATSSITYTGLTTQAAVSESNATDLSEGAYAGADFAASLGSTVSVVVSQGKENRKGSSLPIQLPQIFENSLNKINWKTGKITVGTMQSESGTFYGNCGGSGSYSLTYDDQTGNFTGQFVYYNYCEDSITLSGSVSISGQININTLDFITFNFSFDNVTLTMGADSLTIKGDIHVYVSSASVTITENMLLKNNANNKVYWCKDYNLTITKGGNYNDFAISGTYYHPDYGYVVISTPTPFRIYTVDTTPSSGVLRLAGSGNTSAVLTALTSSTYCIQADTNGCGNNEWDSGVLCYVGGSCSGDMTPPSTPIGLTATAASSSQIDLSWTPSTDNVGVAGYRIYRNGLYLKSVTGTSTSDMGLSASTQYCYKVSAYDAANNESAQSTEACAITPSGGVSIINLNANSDLIFDHVSQKIYASVRGNPGNITPIDPITRSIGPVIPVGIDPVKLACSDNGQFLHVGLDGENSVQRVDLLTQTVNLSFSLGSDSFFGPYYVEDIEVLPGNPQAVAISRRYKGTSPRHAGVAIFDDNIQRPTVTPGHTGSNVIEFSASAGTLYGYNNETSEWGFRRMAVDPSGVTTLDVFTSFMGDLISGYNVDIKFHGGLIYTTSGRVIDPVTRTIVGTFSLPVTYGNLVRPDATVGRVFFLVSEGPMWSIRAFDLNTRQLLGSANIPGISGDPSSLIRWGAKGLAFRTSGGQIFLIESSNLIP